MNYIIQYRNNDFKNATIFLPSSPSADGRVTEILQWIAKANRYFILLRKQSDVENGWIYRVDEINLQGELITSSPEEEIISQIPVRVILEIEGDNIVMRIPSTGRSMTMNVPGEHTDPDEITGDPDPSGPSSGGGSNSGPGGSGGHSGGGVSPLPGGDNEPALPPPPDYTVDNPDEVIETQADRNYYIPEYINIREIIIEVIDKF